MPLYKLTLPPGVLRTGTNYQAEGRWYAAQLVRWWQNTLRPFGGWLKKDAAAHGDGSGRGLLTWRPASYTRQAMFGTPSKLYVWNEDTLLDITPDALPAGIVDSSAGWGYGYGDYGEGDYGTSEATPTTQATSWSLDLWGDWGLAVASHDGTIYQYQNDGGQAQPVANAPTARAILVTDERILMALGASGDPRTIAWCDYEDNTTWTPTTTNAAGDFRLQTDGLLMCGVRTVAGNLILTSTDAWICRFLGGTLVYSFNQLERDCGIIGPRAFQAAEGRVVWMGLQNFFMFDGTYVRPLPCEIYDYVFGDMNVEQSAKFHCGRISAFGEFLFFYCSAGSTEIDRCVSYNWRENHWNTIDGDPCSLMARGAWDDAGAFPLPLAVGTDGQLYEHENGFTNDGSPIIDKRFALSGPIELGDGSHIIEATQMIADEKTFGHLAVYFLQMFSPEDTEVPKGPYYTGSRYVDIRLTARQVAIYLKSLADEDFRWGNQRVAGVVGGER